MHALPVDDALCECRDASVLPDRLTIGQLSRLTGMRPKTIRYYEDIGLLPRPARQANGYRHYEAADVNRLLLLRRIRFLGVPLSVARPLLAGASDARCADVQQELLALTHQRLRALDEEMAELRQLRVMVEGYQHALDACPPDATDQLFGECRDMSCIALPPEVGARREDDHAGV
ncbi:MAG TPA: MerR family transcriptional regulator [Ktedonobacterales bacterium]|nr:MerR family transcriptional regulator [Ktedonobacterales bacterium]